MNEQELREQLKQEIIQEMKKSARKKRIIIFAIILIIIAGIFICYKIDCYRKKQTDKRYTYEELSQYKKEISITAENWKDYVTTEDRTQETKDDFGRITNKDERTILKLKDNIGGYAIFEFEVPNSYFGEKTLSIIGGIDSVGVAIGTGTSRKEGDIIVKNYRYTLDDLKLVQVKGYIYTIDIPEEIWQTDETTGAKYIRLEMGEKLYKDDCIKTLSRRDYNEYEKQIGNDMYM